MTEAMWARPVRAAADHRAQRPVSVLRHCRNRRIVQPSAVDGCTARRHRDRVDPRGARHGHRTGRRRPRLRRAPRLGPPVHDRGRDRTITALAAALAADPTPRLLLAGDLNTTTTDRRFAAFAPLHDTQQEAGAGFGFTWPASLPVLRPDHVLQRGMTTRRLWVTSAPGSDHRAVLADLDTTTPATNVRVGPTVMRWPG
jgi:hypothetical protein